MKEKFIREQFLASFSLFKISQTLHGVFVSFLYQNIAEHCKLWSYIQFPKLETKASLQVNICKARLCLMYGTIPACYTGAYEVCYSKFNTPTLKLRIE